MGADSNNIDFDIIIVGGGIVGLTVACALANHESATGNGTLVDITFEFMDGHENDEVSFIVTSLGGINNDGTGVTVGQSVTIDIGEDIGICEGDEITLYET